MSTLTKSKAQLVVDWKPLLEAEGAPEIAQGKQAIIAKIFENQDKDINSDAAYRDEKLAEAFGGFLTEAEIGGDHGYDRVCRCDHDAVPGAPRRLPGNGVY